MKIEGDRELEKSTWDEESESNAHGRERKKQKDRETR